MPEKPPAADVGAYIRLRRCILRVLYEFFQEYPYGSMELRQITETCDTDSRLLNWNLVYLEKCGYLALDRSPDCPPFVACSASITAQGIDLIEDESSFDRRFSESQET